MTSRTNRRQFLAGLAAGAALTALPGLARAQGYRRPPLAMPPMLDATRAGRFALSARAGESNFLGRAPTPTWGFSQPYLGPTLRLPAKGEVAAEITNTLGEAVSVHWHGLIVPGDVDGGPHQPVAAGGRWTPVLPLDQMPATLWYHSHIHGKTAPQVYRGLAGVIHITDGEDDARALPAQYGIDDLTLVIQDRRFDRRGRMIYDPAMPDRMMGFQGNVLLVNGQIAPFARVPKGVVRLRFLNASNARVLTLHMAEGRPLHLIGTDSGLLPAPVALETLTLAPAERAEVLVDFSDGAEGLLATGPNPNGGMMGGGMMGGGMMRGGGMRGGRDQGFEILPLTVDPALPARITRLPGAIGGSLPDHDPGAVAVSREFRLEMGMGPGMMFRRTGRRFSINGRPFSMRRLDLTARQGALERWVIRGEMMMHPFHVHGCAFQVLSENGRPPALQNRGWKDTVLVNGEAEILVRFPHKASEDLPYMFHCHILEHEDGGMMGQFAVG